MKIIKLAIFTILVTGASLTHGMSQTINKELADAAWKGELYSVKEALNKGADINSVSFLGSTALIQAARKNYTNIVDYLIQNKANVNIKDFLDSTALLEAVRNENLAITTLLLKAGADVKVKDILGDTLIDIARKKDNKKLVEILQQYDKNQKPTIEVPSAKKTTDLSDTFSELAIDSEPRKTLSKDKIDEIINSLNEGQKQWKARCKIKVRDEPTSWQMIQAISDLNVRKIEELLNDIATLTDSKYKEYMQYIKNQRKAIKCVYDEYTDDDYMRESACDTHSKDSHYLDQIEDLIVKKYKASSSIK